MADAIGVATPFSRVKALCLPASLVALSASCVAARTWPLVLFSIERIARTDFHRQIAFSSLGHKYPLIRALRSRKISARVFSSSP